MDARETRGCSRKRFTTETGKIDDEERSLDRGLRSCNSIRPRHDGQGLRSHGRYLVETRVRGNRPMNRVQVNPVLLRWARERGGLSVDALAARFPKVGAWESGEARPTLKQLERFAKATFTPIGFLFLEKPPVERVPIPDFRTVAGATRCTCASSAGPGTTTLRGRRASGRCRSSARRASATTRSRPRRRSGTCDARRARQPAFRSGRHDQCPGGTHLVHRVLAPARVSEDGDVQSTGRPPGHRRLMT